MDGVTTMAWHGARALRGLVRNRLDWLALARRLPRDARLGWQSVILGRQIEVGEGCCIEDGAVLCTRHERSTGADSIRLGRQCRVRRGSHLYSWTGFIRMGDNCTVNTGAVMYGVGGGITIGNNVRIAAGTVMVTAQHNIARTDIPIAVQGGTADPIVVEDDVWVGAGVCVLGGVRVGRGAVLGAGAVVHRDVAPFSIMGGVPARVLRVRRQDELPERG